MAKQTTKQKLEVKAKEVAEKVINENPMATEEEIIDIALETDVEEVQKIIDEGVEEEVKDKVKYFSVYNDQVLVRKYTDEREARNFANRKGFTVK